ncbi:MAG: deoxyguanosinetriphosphate triphosphohydrolase [Verrucomicrobiota bacterium]
MGQQARFQWEQSEASILAPYAQLSSTSRGRAYPDEVHVFRSEFQRDRDRIIHSTAFRRLEYKTQVVLNGTGDHFRTRLTHTIEVSSIARTIARTLRLNEDLAESVALAHDLGHSPFGHPGEHTLDQLMQNQGGFEHNHQSLRVVEHLENKYPEFNGLNLTWEVREGLNKHGFSQNGTGSHPSLEAQVADLSDEIAYCSSDLDDALENQLIQPDELESLDLWSEIESKIADQYSRLEFDRKRRFMIRCLINRLVEDLCTESARLIDEAGIQSPDEARRHPQQLISFSLSMRAKVQNLRDFLLKNFYYHDQVSEVNQRACRVLQALFEFYHDHPAQISDCFAVKIKKNGVHRTVCDYVAGMTDRYALEMYNKHIGTDQLLSELMASSN